MSKLGDLLVADGKLRPEQVAKAREMQDLVGGRLGTNLLELGAVGEDTLLQALGRLRSSPVAGQLDLRGIPADALRAVPPKLVRRYKIVPFKKSGRTLHVASVDPVDPLVEDELGMLSGCLVRAFVGLEVRIQEALHRYYRIPADNRTLALLRRLERGTGRTGDDTGSVAPSAPAAPPPSVIPASLRADRPRTAAPSARPAAGPRPPAAEQFIELDADEMALLYGETPATASAEAAEAAVADVPAADVPVAPVPAVPELAAPAELPDDVVDPEERLHLVSRALQESDIRDEIGDALLAYCAPYCQRRLLLIVRGERIVGWRAEGTGVNPKIVRAIEIGTKEPSVFLGLLQGVPFFRGPLPPMAPNQNLLFGLGGAPPADCLVLPIVLRDRTVAFLYLDNATQGIASAPMPQLRRLVTKAGVAFEVYILKNKIRTL